MTVLPAGHADASWAEAAGPCLRCVLGDAPAPGESETCDTAGVLGPVTSAVASFQAVEALKVLLGRFDKLRRHLLAFDPWNTEFARVDAGPSRQSPRCPCCAERRFEHLDGATMRETTVLCGSGERGAVQLRGGGRANPADLAKRFRNAGLVDVRATPIFARAVIAASAAAQDGPAPIRGDGKSDPSKRPDADAHPADDDPAHADIELTVFADGRAIFRGLGDAARAKALYARFVGG
jgi:adenylyltransferase/sulfurtransferase